MFYRILDRLAARLAGHGACVTTPTVPAARRRASISSTKTARTARTAARRGARRHPRADGSQQRHAMEPTQAAPRASRRPRPGSGNHRASVFRRHVGAALIRRDGRPDDLLRSWLDRRRPPGERASQRNRHRTRGQPPHRLHAISMAQRSRPSRPRLPREQQHRAAVPPRRRTRPAQPKLARPLRPTSRDPPIWPVERRTRR